MSDEPERITLAETDDCEYWWARRKSDGRTARGATVSGALNTLLKVDLHGESVLDNTEFDHSNPPEGIFSADIDKTAGATRHRDGPSDFPPGRPDYYDENPDWADDLSDLGENG
jgi:predicted amidohydrolase